MIGRPEISRLSVAGGVSEGAQEKDYILAWMLAARATLGPSSLVFQGGTALRRCYFPGYRYSEDLDFSADDQPSLEEIWVILDACANGLVITQESKPRESPPRRPEAVRPYPTVVLEHGHHLKAPPECLDVLAKRRQVDVLPARSAGLFATNGSDAIDRPVE